MATTNSNVPMEIYSAKVIDALAGALAPIFAFSLDLSADAAKKGDTIRVPLIAADAAADWNASSNNYGKAAATLTDREVPLTGRKLAGFGVDDLQAANYAPQWWERKAVANVNAVAAAMIADVYALVTADNFGDTDADKIAVSLAGFSTKGVAAIRAKAIAKSMRPGISSLVLNPEFFSALLGSLDSATYGGSEAIRTGRIPRLMGFREVIEAPDMTAPGFICHPDALCVANRYLAPIDPGAYSYAAPATDEDSGLTVGIREYTNPTTGVKSITQEICYGVEIGQLALVRLI